MPEGDSVFRAGAQLRHTLVNKTLNRTDFRHPSFAQADFVGDIVTGVRTVGKHLFLQFSRELSFYSHLRMDGSWQCGTLGSKWRLPAHFARVIFQTADSQAIGFRLHDMKILPTSDENTLIGHLGPDLLDPQWTQDHTERAVLALQAEPHREIGLTLLDQRVMAGIGNVFKVELCFLLGVTPWSPVAAVDAEQTVTLARKLLTINAKRNIRSTGNLPQGRRYWVYEQSRRGCFRCGGPISVAAQGHGVQQRPTWFCPHCQRGPFPE